MKPLKLFQTADDLEFISTPIEIEHEGIELENIELAEIELRNGKSIRVTIDEDEDCLTYMAVVFSGAFVETYVIAETKEELTKWMIAQQKIK